MCPYPKNDDGDSQTVSAVDPNQKLGPGGKGDKKWMSASEVFLYRIDFENDPDATAPAQRVDIFDALSEKMDPSTVRVLEVGFNGRVYVNVDEETTGSLFETRVKDYAVSNSSAPFDVIVKAGV